MTRRRKVILSVREATPAAGQHTRPCSDCPLRRDSVAGWLGGSLAEDYAQLLHSSNRVDCHVHAGAQCAGAAIYRTNVLKEPRPGEDYLQLPADRTKVFANPLEFLAHHAEKAREVFGTPPPARPVTGNAHANPRPAMSDPKKPPVLHSFGELAAHLGVGRQKKSRAKKRKHKPPRAARRPPVRDRR